MLARLEKSRKTVPVMWLRCDAAATKAPFVRARLTRAGMATAKHRNRALPGARDGNALAGIRSDRRYRRSGALRNRLRGSCSALAVEDQPPLDIIAARALQRMVLVAGDLQGRVRHHLHQAHLRAAHHTTHRTYPLTNDSRIYGTACARAVNRSPADCSRHVAELRCDAEDHRVWTQPNGVGDLSRDG